MTCHKEKSPGLYNQWYMSTHAIHNVTCIECHGADKSEVDLEIARILDGSPYAVELLRSAMESYRAMPQELKYQVFDPDTVDMTAPGVAVLDLDTIGDGSPNPWVA